MGFEFLIKHVVEAAKGAFFDAAGEGSTEESFAAFSFIDVSGGFANGLVAVEVGQFKASFDNIEGVG